MLPFHVGPSANVYRYRNRKILLIFGIALGFLIRLLLIAIDSNDFTLLTFSILGILVMIILFWRRVEHPGNTQQQAEEHSSNGIDLEPHRREEISSTLFNSVYIYKILLLSVLMLREIKIVVMRRILVAHNSKIIFKTLRFFHLRLHVAYASTHTSKMKH